MWRDNLFCFATLLSCWHCIRSWLSRHFLRLFYKGPFEPNSVSIMNNSKKLYDLRGNDKNQHKVASIAPWFLNFWAIKPDFFLCVRIHEKTLPDFFQIFELISSGCTSALKWTQLTLNGLYKKKLQFSRYSNETCFI